MSPPPFVYAAAFCAAVNSALLGYDIGVAGGAMFLAKDELQLSDFDTEIILSTLNFFAIPGALLSRPISDNYGRTKTLALASAFFLCGSLIMASAGGFTMLLVGRMLLGLGTGCGLSIDPLYISEMSPPESRGILVSWSEFSINIGILLGFTANAIFSALRPGVAWRVMLGLGAVMPVAMLYLSLHVMPETPRFLMKVGREEEAREVMEKICPNSPQDVDNTMVQMRRALAGNLSSTSGSGSVGSGVSVGSIGSGGSGGGGGQPRFWELVQNPDPVIRFMLATVCLVAVGQQLSGVEALMYYTPFMLQDVGFSSRQQILTLTALMGLAKTATLVFAACMLDAPRAFVAFAFDWCLCPITRTSYFRDFRVRDYVQCWCRTDHMAVCL